MSPQGNGHTGAGSRPPGRCSEWSGPAVDSARWPANDRVMVTRKRAAIGEQTWVCRCRQETGSPKNGYRRSAGWVVLSGSSERAESPGRIDGAVHSLPMNDSLTEQVRLCASERDHRDGMSEAPNCSVPSGGKSQAATVFAAFTRKSRGFWPWRKSTRAYLRVTVLDVIDGSEEIRAGRGNLSRVSDLRRSNRPAPKVYSRPGVYIHGIRKRRRTAMHQSIAPSS